MKKKIDPLTIAIYAIIVLVVLYASAALGAALQLSLKDNGEIDFNVFGEQFESVMTDTDTVFAHLTDKNSYGFKLTLIAAFSIALYAVLKYTTRKRLHRKGVEHGSARWATEKEAKVLADKPPKGKPKSWKIADTFYTDNNILLTNDVRMSLNTRQYRENLNVLVIGGSGSGKSRFFVKPNLMQLNTSYVVTDPKGELLRSCGRLLEKAGYEIRVFNLIDMSHSCNYNPFNYVFDQNGEVNKSYVLKMVNCLMKNTKQEGSSGGDQFWDDATKSLTLAISFYLLEKEQLNTMDEKAAVMAAEEMYKNENNEENLAILEQAKQEYADKLALEHRDSNFSRVMQVMKMAEISEQDDTMQSPLDDLMLEHSLNFPGSMAYTYYQDFKKAPAETAKSILISAAVRFAAFELPEVADLTHTDNINLNTLGDKKTALFVIIPSSDATFNFLAAMMYTQLFDTLYDAANFKYGGRLPVHVRCLLDEFANVGTIPDFDKLLATMRSMEISANIIIQNLAQLKKMYDKSWEILTGNCDSLLFLGGQEASTLEAISKSLGKETIDVVSQNRTRGAKNNSSSENNSIMGRELLTTDELKVMKPMQCVLIVRAFYPFFGNKFNIEKHPNYKFLEDSNKKYAYEIHDLHTEKCPDTTGLDTEDFVPAEYAAPQEKMQYDIGIPQDDNDNQPSVEDEFADEIKKDLKKEQDMVNDAETNYTTPLFDEVKHDDLKDEALPTEISSVDMAIIQSFGEGDFSEFYEN